MEIGKSKSSIIQARIDSHPTESIRSKIGSTIIGKYSIIIWFGIHTRIKEPLNRSTIFP